MSSNKKPDWTYKHTAGIGSLLEVLKNKIRWESFNSLYELRKRLKSEQDELTEKKRSYDWAASQVAARENEIKKVKREIAEIMSDLTRLGCPEEKVQSIIKECGETFTAHEVADWLTWKE